MNHYNMYSGIYSSVVVGHFDTRSGNLLDWRFYRLVDEDFEMLQMLWCLSLSSDMIGFRGASGL
jgi:hypothetical protein